MNLDTPVFQLTRVGKATAKRLKNLGIETVRDLIFYLPFRYEDYGNIIFIDQLRPGIKTTIKGKIQLIQNKRSPRQRKFLTEALVADQSGTVKIVWFNRNYLTKYLKPGMELYISGSPSLYSHELYFNNPLFESVKEIKTVHTSGIIPIYHLTAQITQKQLRFLISLALKCFPQIIDWMPEEIIKNFNLCSLSRALQQVHFPQSNNDLQKARRRLQFNELFLLQLFSEKAKLSLKNSPAYKINFDESLTKKFVQNLPFVLTNAQRRVSWEILSDLQKSYPMNRLLEGDVGSGKTVVATIALLNAWQSGYQSSMMAATEILAKQHFKTISVFLKKWSINVALLTREECKLNEKEISKKELLNKIEEEEVDVVIGTHALIQKVVQFSKLALIIIDEQHRFGVGQRKALRYQDKKIIPHFFSMTATPIPRSLALAFYGELNLSIIDEMPKGRKRVLTKIVNEKDRAKAYKFIAEQINKKRQVFIVCPLINKSDKLGVKSVEEEYKKLQQKVFSKFNIAMLHGKMKNEEKEEIMRKYREGSIDILVATSIVEVGIDIPNANIIVIEGAERFGLAQLHQFRGRVGRGKHVSYCFLFTYNQNQKTRQRLQALVDSYDGFSLAEKDLELRGAGEIYGTRQSGIDSLKIADLTDYQLLKEAKKAATFVMDNSEDLSLYPFLKKKFDSFQKSVHLE